MEVKDLEAFVVVAEELHFGRAAAKLHMSQPPLSARIRQLEQSLGLRLFERSTRSVALTDAGSRLLVPARKVLSQVASVQNLAESIAAGDQGRVRIAFAGASSQRALPILTRAVRESYPGIELQLESQTYVYTALDKLLEGTLDLAFARLPTPQPELESRVVEVEQILCALPEGHPRANQPNLSLADLHDEDFVSLPSDTGSILQATMFALCITAGFRPRVVQISPDSATALALVAAGAGITITLSSVTPAQSVGIVYRELVDIHPSHMFATLTWRKDDPSPALSAVLEVSRSALPTPDLSGFDLKL